MSTKRVWDIEISTKGDKILLKTDGYDPTVVSNIKLYLPKPRTWLKNEKVWSLPLMWETCTSLRQLANRHSAKLRIGPTLLAWATEQAARRAEIPDVNDHKTKLQLPRLQASRPDLYEKLMPFQTVGIKFAATARSILIADQPGSGKTLQSIAAVIEANLTGPILVVAAPKSAAVITWPNQLRTWFPEEIAITISGAMKPADRQDAIHRAKNYVMQGKRVWVVTSPNYVRMRCNTDDYGNYTYTKGKKDIYPIRETLVDLFGIQWSAIIVDESHKTLATGTGNRKKWSAQRIGLELLPLRENGIRIALSGTPFRGKEENAYGTLQWLRPDLYRGFWGWAEKHFSIYSDGYGQIIGGITDKEGFYEELRQFMVRRTKEEIAPEMPPKRYGGEPYDPTDPNSPVAVWLPMEGKQATQYKQMVKSAKVDMLGGELSANGVLAELTRLKQFACSAGELRDGTFYPVLPSNKFSWIVDFLSDRDITKDMKEFAPEDLKEVGKVIIASQFTKLLNLFRKELEAMGIECHILTGETSEKDRIAAQEDWQTNPYSHKRVFLLNMIAGGASIDLDKMCDDVIIVDKTYNRDDQEQVEDRAHRLSNQEHTVTIWELVSQGTIEEGIAVSTLLKDMDIKGILDGARGVELIRYLVEGPMAA